MVYDDEMNDLIILISTKQYYNAGSKHLLNPDYLFMSEMK